MKYIYIHCITLVSDIQVTTHIIMLEVDPDRKYALCTEYLKWSKVNFRFVLTDKVSRIRKSTRFLANT